jgi:hypothetical protein
LNVPNAHARAKEWFNQAAPGKNLQHGWLKSGSASLVMRGGQALDDARLDTVAKKLAGREQSGWAAPHDQDGRCECTILTGNRQLDFSSVDGSFVHCEGNVVAASGTVQWRSSVLRSTR